jgi:hypothetical protein
MKKLFFLLLLGFGILKAQEANIKWGLLFSPEIKNKVLFDSPFQGFRDNEYAGLGYSFGVIGLKTLSEKRELEFGIHYTNKGYRSYFIGRFGDQIDPTQGFIGEPSEIHTNYNYNYLCLPIKMNNYITPKFFIASALQPEILMNANSINIEGEERSKSKSENIKPFNVSISIGFVRVFNFNSFALRIEPHLNSSVINLYKKSVVSEHLYNIGLSTKWVLY